MLTVSRAKGTEPITNLQMFVLIGTILGAQLGALLYLRSRVDRLCRKVDRAMDTMDTVHRVELIGR
jgi:uncharacterized membrane protein YciS (DUF1049 family)